MRHTEPDRRPADPVWIFFLKDPPKRTESGGSAWFGAIPPKIGRYGSVRHGSTLNQTVSIEHMESGGMWMLWWDLGYQLMVARLSFLIESREVLSELPRDALRLSTIRTIKMSSFLCTNNLCTYLLRNKFESILTFLNNLKCFAQ